MLTRLLLAILLPMTLLLGACGNESAPQLTDSSGQAIKTDGNWLLINYWAVWCKPCRAEVPELNALHHELKDQQVLILGYNFDQLESKELLDASKQLGIEFPVLSNAAMKQLDLPNAAGLPVTYLINPQGKYSARLLCEQTRDSLLAALETNGALPAVSK